ncbi:MAG: FHA domain-containing protein [Roseibacillus sp.]
MENRGFVIPPAAPCLESALTGKLINEATGEVFELEEVSSIGRSRDSVVVVPDPCVSRRHALIRAHDDGFWFFDLGSVNGSSLNGRRITTSLLLQTGDEVKIGDHIYRFEATGVAIPTEDLTDATIVDVRSCDAILLVCDIQGFTTLAEKLEPDQLAPIIGSW